MDQGIQGKGPSGTQAEEARSPQRDELRPKGDRGGDRKAQAETSIMGSEAHQVPVQSAVPLDDGRVCAYEIAKKVKMVTSGQSSMIISWALVSTPSARFKRV